MSFTSRSMTGNQPLSTWSFVLMILAPLLMLYAITTDWSQPYHVDAQTNALEAWTLGVDGSPYIDGYEDADLDKAWASIAFLVRTDEGRVISKYPPGAALLAAPLYAVTRPEAPVSTLTGSFRGVSQGTLTGPLPPVWQASVSAAIATAIAVTLLGLAMRSLVDDRTALLAALVFGLGTTAWSIAADALWQHGPAMMWLGLGLLGSSSCRWARSGLGFAGAVITRPQTALIAFVHGIWESTARRSIRPAMWIGMISTVGALGFLAWNRLVIGDLAPGPRSIYSLDVIRTVDPFSLPLDAIQILLHPHAGILIWSPVIFPLLFGLRSAWNESPSWVRSAAIGGFLYLITTVILNNWRGGQGHFTYRYPLEFLFVATPLLALSYKSVATTPWRVRLTAYLALISITIHGAGALVQ